jgi:hypothetical protein
VNPAAEDSRLPAPGTWIRYRDEYHICPGGARYCKSPYGGNYSVTLDSTGYERFAESKPANNQPDSINEPGVAAEDLEITAPSQLAAGLRVQIREARRCACWSSTGGGGWLMNFSSAASTTSLMRVTGTISNSSARPRECLRGPLRWRGQNNSMNAGAMARPKNFFLMPPHRKHQA